MKTADYKCINGANHTEKCCDECWNGHPDAMPNEMFMGTIVWKEIVKSDWIDDARANGFSYLQAEFLYKIK